MKLRFKVSNNNSSLYKVGNSKINFNVSWAIIVPIIPVKVPKTPFTEQFGTSSGFGGSGKISLKFLEFF